MSETKLVYVSKYALTSGIMEVEAKLSREKGYLIVNGVFLKENRDCFESREAAVKDAKARRAKKIKSLEGQIKNIQNMEFK